MCILSKLHYAKLDVSGLFCSKVIEEKSLGGRLYFPPPGKGRVNTTILDQNTESLQKSHIWRHKDVITENNVKNFTFSKPNNLNNI